MGVTVLVFAVEQQKVCTKCISSEFWERTGASFKMACIWKGRGGGGVEQKFNIYYRGSPLAGPTQQQTLLYIMHIPNTSSLISARNNPKRKFQ